MGKKIKVFGSTRSGMVEINSDASTWGELKTELANEGLLQGDMKAVIREGQTEMKTNSQTLPTGLGFNDENEQTHDFTLFLNPIKTKSGSINS